MRSHSSPHTPAGLLQSNPSCELLMHIKAMTILVWLKCDTFLTLMSDFHTSSVSLTIEVKTLDISCCSLVWNDQTAKCTVTNLAEVKSLTPVLNPYGI